MRIGGYMKIKIIDFGGRMPERAHYNDAGADLFVSEKTVVPAQSIKKVPLGIGIELPDGFVAFALPRSGMSSIKGLTTEVVPIDSGYRGEIHAIVYNSTNVDFELYADTKIAQLVIVPCVIADFCRSMPEKRGINAFNSTGGADGAIANRVM